MKKIREMTLEEVIEKYRITAFPGPAGAAGTLSVIGELTPEEKEAIGARKAEILAELKRRKALQEERYQAEALAKMKRRQAEEERRHRP